MAVSKHDSVFVFGAMQNPEVILYKYSTVAAAGSALEVADLNLG